MTSSLRKYKCIVCHSCFELNGQVLTIGQYFDPTSKEELLNPKDNKLGCPFGTSCRYAHPSDPDWNSCSVNTRMAELHGLRPKNSSSDWDSDRSRGPGSRAKRPPTPEKLKHARSQQEIKRDLPPKGSSSYRSYADTPKDPRRPQKEWPPPRTPSDAIPSPQQSSFRQSSFATLDRPRRFSDAKPSPVSPVSPDLAMDVDKHDPPKLHVDTSLQPPPAPPAPPTLISNSTLEVQVDAARKEEFKQNFLQLCNLVKFYNDLQYAKKAREELQSLVDLHPDALYRDELTRADSTIAKLISEMDIIFVEFLSSPFAAFVSNHSTSRDELSGQLEKYVQATKEDIGVIGDVLNDHGRRIIALESRVPLEPAEQEEDQTQSGKRCPAADELETMVNDLQETVDKLRLDLDELKETEQQREKFPKGPSVEQQFSLLLQTELEPKLKRWDEVSKGNTKDLCDLRVDTTRAFENISSINKNLEDIQLESKDFRQAAEQEKKVVVENTRVLQSLQKELDKALQNEKIRGQELHKEKQERLRLQSSHDALKDKYDKDLSALKETVAQLSKNLQEQTSNWNALTGRIDDVLRDSYPQLEGFLKRTEQRIREDFLPDTITRILTQQEENVVQKLIPRLDPMLRLVEKMYKLTTPDLSK